MAAGLGYGLRYPVLEYGRLSVPVPVAATGVAICNNICFRVHVYSSTYRYTRVCTRLRILSSTFTCTTCSTSISVPRVACMGRVVWHIGMKFQTIGKWYQYDLQTRSCQVVSRYYFEIMTAVVSSQFFSLVDSPSKSSS